jgi:hypothetical protein
MRSLRRSPLPFSRAPRCLRQALLGFALFGICWVQGRGQSNSADEYEIRAAMLLNLTRFIDWPAAKLDAGHPQFLVCILGQDPITPFVDRFLQNQTVDAKPVRVEHLSTLDAAGSCHMLYVGASERKSLGPAYAELMKNNVLILSERPNTSSPNQVIGLPSIDEHVHIEVDLSAAQRSGITFSSKLLRLATVTH